VGVVRSYRICQRKSDAEASENEKGGG
jgi:hypothetical protein